MIYPTLFTDPEQKRIFEKQCDYPGGMFSHRIRGRQGGGVRFPAPSADRAQRRVARRRGDRWRAIRNRPPIPACRAEELARSGVTDGLVRISVGIEDWRDLLADFEQALAAV